jgi:protein-tyrosine phosphatase
VIEANEIVPGLWQGSIPPRGNTLARYGFNAVVLAAVELQLPAHLFEGVDVLHAPNEDDGSPLTREQLIIAISAAKQVAARVTDGQKVLSTCAQGVNRSGLVTALALHFIYGWNGDHCIGVVRRKRKLANGRRALSNQFFTEALRKLTGVPKQPRLSPEGLLLV